jgi:hypothetical protein
MAFGLAKLKQDFAKHKAKAAVLSTLSLVMAVLVIKGLFEMMPQSAAAGATPGSVATTLPESALAAIPTDTEERVRQGQQLWRLLRERRGISPGLAFTFESSYFIPDPNRKSVPAAEVDPRIGPPQVASTRPATSEEAERQRKIATINLEAEALKIRSTVVGARPVAIINNQILSVGDRILQFEVLAIHAREVEFRKDDVTLAVKMVGDAPSR